MEEGAGDKEVDEEEKEDDAEEFGEDEIYDEDDLEEVINCCFFFYGCITDSFLAHLFQRKSRAIVIVRLSL